VTSVHCFGLQLFLVDLITVTKANCAQPMNYYQSLLVTLISFKAFVVFFIVVAWLVPVVNTRLRAYRQWLSVPKHLRSRSARRRSKRRIAAPMARRRSILGRLRSTDWVKVRRQRPVSDLFFREPASNIHFSEMLPRQVFRVVSMVLFIAYPSVSIKLLRLFNCINVAGGWYIEDDVRLPCFDSQW
jgi:hypothetical protein